MKHILALLWSILFLFHSPFTGHVDSVTLNKTDITLSPGQSETLVATLKPDGVRALVTWSSSDAKVCTVDENGKVTAVSPGTATINVKARSQKAKCTVTVKYNMEPVDIGIVMADDNNNLYRLLWGDRNLGAVNIYDYGGYFAWGETGTKSGNYSKTYTLYDDKDNPVKYNIEDGKKVLDPEDDAASVILGDGWRTPTAKELQAFIDCVQWDWDETNLAVFANGVNGAIAFGYYPTYNDSYNLFFPAAGSMWKSLTSGGTDGNYLSSTLSPDNNNQNLALILRRNGSNASRSIVAVPRPRGLTVRPVKPVEFDPMEEGFRLVMNKSEARVAVGNTITLEAEFSPRVYGAKIVWDSSDPSVATVEDGVVKGVGGGKATVSAWFGGLFHAACEVEVVAPKFVDLGMVWFKDWNDKNRKPCRLLWADRNLGALEPEDFGNYYAWGETEPKTTSSWSNYKFRMSGDTDEDVKFWKYNYHEDMGRVDRKDVLEPEDDAASVLLGGGFRMPTEGEFDELDEYDFTFGTKNGVSGYYLKGKGSASNNEIFLPSSRCLSDDAWTTVTSEMFLNSADVAAFWTSSLLSGRVSFIKGFRGDRSSATHGAYRYYLLPIRPVLLVEDEDLSPDSITLNYTSVQLQTGLTCKLEKKTSPYLFDLARAGWQWLSSNPGVATVDEEGLISAKKPGTAIITAKYGSTMAQCVVVVTSYEVPKGAVDIGFVIENANGEDGTYEAHRLFWAECNLGASKPEEYGDYYAWGELEKNKKVFDWSTYKWCNGSKEKITKYCNSKYAEYWDGKGSCDNKYSLDPEDDAAHVILGGKWRMPTEKEIMTLTSFSDSSPFQWTWADRNGVNGCYMRNKDEKNYPSSIFLPAAGYRLKTDLLEEQKEGLYRCSELYNRGNHFYDTSTVMYVRDGHPACRFSSRFDGYPIRPVTE